MATLPRCIALVTGASRGVGRGIAESLGEAGATVYVTGRSGDGVRSLENLPGTIEETAERVNELGGHGIPVRCDHTDDDQVEALFMRIRDEAGRLDLLVNNVWGGYEGYGSAAFDAPFWVQPMWRWRGMVDAGLRAHFTASRMAAPMMIERKSGLIVNISSGDREHHYLGNAMYDTVKAGVDRMAFAMAQDLRAYNVAVVAVYPGFVRTERVAQHFEKAGEPVPDNTETARYVGRAVAHLAADANVMTRTGQTLLTGDLAREYHFTDIDGRRPPPFDIAAAMEEEERAKGNG